MKKETIIISLGGSLVVPDEIDIDFLKFFKKEIEFNLSENRFVIICGGGSIARKYQEAARKFSNSDVKGEDRLGIEATSLNALLLKLIFKEKTYSKVIKNPRKKIDFKEDILIASGWKPGCSTDYDAVLLAENFGADKILNLTDIDYVYDKDPDKFKDAAPLEKVSWADFRKILPSKWKPGLNAPFDPVAAKRAQKTDVEVVILNGRKKERIKKYLREGKIEGTLITS